MDLTKPITINFPEGTTTWHRLKVHFGHLDLRVYKTRTAYVDVGAGSLACVNRIGYVPDQYAGSLGMIGRYNEWALDSLVLASGEHDNDQPVNVSMTGMPMVALLNPALEAGVPGSMRPIQQLRIGNGVVICGGAKVMPGVTIGDGAVIGAQAVVVRDVGNREIVAGVPARTLRTRQGFEHGGNGRCPTF